MKKVTKKSAKKTVKKARKKSPSKKSVGMKSPELKKIQADIKQYLKDSSVDNYTGRATPVVAPGLEETVAEIDRVVKAVDRSSEEKALFDMTARQNVYQDSGIRRAKTVAVVVFALVLAALALVAYIR